AWRYFRATFEANGLEVTEDYPGICGSGQPAGAFVAAAKHEGRHYVDGTFLLNLLLAGRPDSDREQLEHIPHSLLIDLCLRDRTVDSDLGIARLVQPSESGGYVAARELYQLLGLTPPREIVSFDERVRLRFEDDDPDLPAEAANGVALVLSEGDARQRP